MKYKIRRHTIKLKHYIQHTGYSCGPTCLRMMLERFGKDYSEEYLRQITKCDNDGTDERQIIDGLKKLGFNTINQTDMKFKKLLEKLRENIPLLTAIRSHNDGHYVIIVGYDREYIHLADPASERQIRRVNKNRFKSLWKESDNWALEIINEKAKKNKTRL